jgi:hypothetical protein
MNITFDNLNLYQLKQLVKTYNSFVNIKITKLKKHEIIKELEKHLEIIDNIVQLKNISKNLDVGPPKRIFTEAEILEKEFKKLLPVKKKLTKSELLEKQFIKSFPKLKGKGVLDYVKNLFTANDRYTNKANNMLKKYGAYEIVNIEVQRSPIISVIDKALNILSLIYYLWENGMS